MNYRKRLKKGKLLQTRLPLAAVGCQKTLAPMASMKIKNANDVNERIARPEAPEMNLHHLTRIFLLASRHATLLSEVIRLSDIHALSHAYDNVEIRQTIQFFQELVVKHDGKKERKFYRLTFFRSLG